MNQAFTIALLLAGLAFIISLVYNPLPFLRSDLSVVEEAQTIELAGQSVRMTVANTPETRTQGLSGKGRLDDDEGMLFVFPEDGIYSFWMKDMQFSIDIIWISYSGNIVDIRERVSPESYPTVFTPREEARYVVELPAGWVEEYDVKVGDIVRL
jgi:hypothetical protein